VKIVEQILKKAEDVNAALLAHRTTPLGPNTPSPAELMFRRKIPKSSTTHKIPGIRSRNHRKARAAEENHPEQ
jgi:hypothetical protein